jgi:hypothetical protein
MEGFPCVVANIDIIKKEIIFAFVVWPGVMNYLLLITKDALPNHRLHKLHRFKPKFQEEL